MHVVMRPLVAVVLLSAFSIAAKAQTAAGAATNLLKLDRAYQPGQALQYEMIGSNHGWKYQFHVDSVAKKDSDGGWFEEIAWSNLRSNAPMKMSAESEAFRQKLSLSGDPKYLAGPDLSNVRPFLIGPITDTLTFYADLFLAKKLKLAQVGQHAYFESGTPNSWADGMQVIVGEDVIDFDLTLVSANPNDHTAELLVKHVPPKQQRLKLQASWMETPVRMLPNNWVQVMKSGRWICGAGGDGGLRGAPDRRHAGWKDRRSEDSQSCRLCGAHMPGFGADAVHGVEAGPVGPRCQPGSDTLDVG